MCRYCILIMHPSKGRIIRFILRFSNFTGLFKTAQPGAPPFTFSSFAASALAFDGWGRCEAEKDCPQSTRPGLDQCSFLSAIRAAVRKIRWHPTNPRDHECCLEPERSSNLQPHSKD